MTCPWCLSSVEVAKRGEWEATDGTWRSYFCEHCQIGWQTVERPESFDVPKFDPLPAQDS